MTIDPTQIELTPEQQARIAILAESQNRSWQEVLNDAVENISFLGKQDLLAIAASIRDMEGGVSGRPFNAFAKEFRQRNQIPN